VASWGEARPDTAAATMLGPAWSLRWRAPELALFLAERARAVIELAGDGPARLRAEATAVVASCRLGQRLDVVDRAIDAIRLAERHTDPVTGAMLRIELAGCARTAGVPLVGAAVLRPVLTAPDVQPATRADALVQLAGCLTRTVDTAVLDGALAEADRLYDEDRQLDPDSRVVQRALLRSVASGEQRRRGDARAAIDAAQEGVDLLGSLSRPTADNGQAGAQVALRLVHGLLDLGRVDEAAIVAAAELRRPVRAPAAGAVGWLAVAMAVRAHMATGAAIPALGLLREAAELGKRHRLSSLRAEALTILSDAHERVGQLTEALDCLRTAQGVRLGRARVVYSARTRLVSAFGETTSPEEFVRMLGIPAGRRSVAGREPSAGLSRIGTRPTPPRTPIGDVTMVLVDLTTPRGDNAGAVIGEHVLSHVLDRLRDAAPSDAQVARVGGAELAVLLPGAPVEQAERWVAELRGAMASVDWSAFTPGLTVAVRSAVAEPASRRPAQPRPAAGMFELPTVPFAPQPGTARPSRSRSTRSGTESPASQALLAKALEQWRQTKSPEPPASAEGPTPTRTDERTPTPPSGEPIGTTTEQPDPTAQPTPAADKPDRPRTGGSDWASRFEAARAALAGLTGEPTQSAEQVPSAAEPREPTLPSASDQPAALSTDTGSSREPGWSPLSDRPAGGALSTDSGPLQEPSTRDRVGGAEGALAADWPGQAVSPETGAGWSDEGGGSVGSTLSGGTEWSSTSNEIPTGEPSVSDWPSGSDWLTAAAGNADWATRFEAAQAAKETTEPHPTEPEQRSSEEAAFTGDPLPALPIPPPLEPEPPTGAERFPLSADPSIRISASDIAAADTPEMGFWAPRLPPPEPAMDWPTATDERPSMADPEQTGPRHAVDSGEGRSVLSSLGITAGGTGGGRRRAKDEPAEDPESEHRPRTVSFDDVGYLEPLTPPELWHGAQDRHDEPEPPTPPSGWAAVSWEREPAANTETAPWEPEPAAQSDAASWERESAASAASWQREPAAQSDSVSWEPETGAQSDAASWEREPAAQSDSARWERDPAARSDSASWERESAAQPATAWERGPAAQPDAASWEPRSDTGSWQREPGANTNAASWQRDPAAQSNTGSWQQDSVARSDAPSWDREPAAQSNTASWDREPVAKADTASFAAQWQPQELPAQHSPIADPAPLQVPPPTTPIEAALATEGADERTEPIREPEPEPEQPKPAVRTGRRRRSVQLADLLTEALMAYQTAQDANDARNNPLAQDPSSGLPGPTSLPEPLAGSAGRDLGRDVASGGSTRIGDSRWLTTRWDPTTDRP